MMRTAAAFVSLLALSLSCSDRSQQEARERAAHAREEARSEALRARSEARKFGSEAKDEAKKLGHNINHALNDSGSGAGADARAKLHRGEQDLRVAGDQAAVKLSHAALLAKVKTKLASDLGVSTLNKIDVDVSGGVVTLRGSVASDSERQQAERAASQISGVTRVVNDLKIQP